MPANTPTYFYQLGEAGAEQPPSLDEIDAEHAAGADVVALIPPGPRRIVLIMPRELAEAIT